MLDFGYYNMDCMEGMKQFPDKYFDLAIVDPPYGDGGGSGVTENVLDNASTATGTIPRGGWHGKQAYHLGTPKRSKSTELVEPGRRSSEKIIAWDVAPKQEYFDELFRVSRNQIIWGGNYFQLPPTRCFLIWRKINVPQDFSMAMCEYAWTSFNGNAKWFEKSAVGQQGRFHPTQKPIELYKWIITNYAKDGDKILDTHVGSASSLIACEELGFKYVGFEIDETYYKLGQERLERNRAQVTITELLND